MDGYEGYEPHSHYTPNAGYESGSSLGSTSSGSNYLLPAAPVNRVSNNVKQCQCYCQSGAAGR